MASPSFSGSVTWPRLPAIAGGGRRAQPLGPALRDSVFHATGISGLRLARTTRVGSTPGWLRNVPSESFALLEARGTPAFNGWSLLLVASLHCFLCGFASLRGIFVRLPNAGAATLNAKTPSREEAKRNPVVPCVLASFTPLTGKSLRASAGPIRALANRVRFVRIEVVYMCPLLEAGSWGGEVSGSGNATWPRGEGEGECGNPENCQPKKPGVRCQQRRCGQT